MDSPPLTPVDSRAIESESLRETDECRLGNTARISFLAILLAPWRWMFSPPQLAKLFREAPTAAVALTFLFHTALVAVAAVMACARFATFFRPRSSSHPPGSWSMARIVLGEWLEAGIVGPLGLIVLITFASITLMVAVLAWLLLPNAHDGGSPGASCRRSLRAVVSGGGLFVLCILNPALGFCSSITEEGPEGIGAVFFLLFLAGAAICTIWLISAARAVGRIKIIDTPAPRCEQCGYDLTHQPECGLCSECGLRVSESLTPGARRAACAWERRRSVGGYLSTACLAIFSPAKHYGSLRLRTPENDARAFSVATYLSMAALACLWILAFLLIEIRDISFPVIIFPFYVLFLVPLAGWLIHRSMSAIATSYWLARSFLPDPRSGHKLIAYESAFLWIFCAFNGGLLTSFFIWGDWPMKLATIMNLRAVIGRDVAPVLLAGGNLLLCAIWLFRFHIAGKAIRWSNF